ncbi:MAG: hypothetical protein ACOCXG_03475 [Nanoarchaeota archaeon]
MLSEVLKTPVDNLVEIVKSSRETTIDTLKSKLNLPIEIIEKWLVVLEEYKILKVHYKGFEGFVEFVEKNENKKQEIDVDNLKETFMNLAKEKNFTYDKMREAWPIFLSKYEVEIKELFEVKAKRLGFDQNKTQLAWQRYRRELEVL